LGPGGVIGGAVVGIATLAVLFKLYPRRGPSSARVLMAAGVVVVVLGAVLVVLDPWDTAGAGTAAAVLGGPSVFLVGELIARRALTGRVAASRVVALGCLVVVALIAFALPALVLAALALAVLLLLLLAASGWFRLPSMNVDE
jgi:low temperature requirement protein LtrA